MAEKSDISTALKRQLRSGKEYDKLMPAVKCESTPLGEGDTFFTVDQMRTWIETYRWQTAKLALKLQGRSLEETVNNIYRFLYDHVQYTADGALQQLRSPACTWAQRKAGTDCKSYSVFASSILLNLGIKHAIRQVRQPYFYPEEFTHVYVVIPVDQSVETISENAPTLIIDATKHQNTEVEYIQKADLHMNKLAHVGLNAPQNERTKNIIENFEKFSKFLIEKGIAVATVNAMRQEVSKYTSQGIDPKFNIIDNGLVIQGKLFRLNFPDNGLNFAVTGAAAITAGKSILKMLPANFIGDTFGAIFANGFDLSCWNSASSPSEAQGVITKKFLPFIEGKFETIKNPSGNQDLIKGINDLNRFASVMNNLYTKASQNGKYAKCTREGYKIYAEFTLPIRKQMSSVIDGLKHQYNLTTQTVRENKFTNNEFEHPIDVGADKEFVDIEIITSISEKSTTEEVIQGGKEMVKKAGSNTGLIVGGVALAAIPFILPMIKKSK